MEKKIIKIFKKNKIQFGKHYPQSLNKIKAIKEIFNNEKYPNAEFFSKYGISLPIDPNLKTKDLKKICSILNLI